MHVLAAPLLAVLLTAIRAPHPMPLDPALTDPAWARGEIQPDNYWNLTKRGPAQLSTHTYLLYDDRNVYVAFRVDQAGVPVVANQTTNNVGFGLDDFVGVAVDTSGAGSTVYFFETTPRGIRYQQASENARYRPRWQSAASVEKNSWSAVLIVPLSVLRLSSSSAQTWHVNFVRAVAAQGEHYTWAYDPLMVDGAAGQSWPAFGDAQYWPSLRVAGLGGGIGRPKPAVAVYGLASAGSDRNLFQQANGTFGPEKIRWTGADFSVPITRTMNLVGTVNPDFSNIEVDQQTIAPQEFARQLIEYRPFFAQGAKYVSPSEVGFSSPTAPNNQIFYSPSIGPFDWGAKVEGSFGWQSLGVLTFRGFDETSGNTFDDTAFGYKHALPDNTFAYWVDGVLAHHSIAGNDTTTDAGALWRNAASGLQWGTDQMIEQGSWVPVTGSTHDSQQFVALNKANYQMAFGYNDVGPNYNPIDGLTFNSDLKGFQGYASASGATSWLKNFTVTALGDRWFDKSGAVHEADMDYILTAAFKNGFSINALGPSISILRSYDVPAGPGCTGPSTSTTSFSGFPCYRNGQDSRYNLFTAAAGYRDGTPAPIDASYAFGPFGPNYTQFFTLSTSRPLGRYSIALEYDGTYERAFATGDLNSQFLRKVSLGQSIGPESNVSLSLASINGLGGFATQTGVNFAVAYHQRFTGGNELFVNYGTPAAYATLNRFLVKYVLHEGADL